MVLFKDKNYDRQKVLTKCSRQFFAARAERRAAEKAALPGTMAAAGTVQVPASIQDNVVWQDPETGKSYIRIPGFRTVMIFQVEFATKSDQIVMEV